MYMSSYMTRFYEYKLVIKFDFILFESVGLENLGTNNLQYSADDKKTWKQKTDEVLRGRCALVVYFIIIIVFYIYLKLCQV